MRLKHAHIKRLHAVPDSTQSESIAYAIQVDPTPFQKFFKSIFPYTTGYESDHPAIQFYECITRSGFLTAASPAGANNGLSMHKITLQTLSRNISHEQNNSNDTSGHSLSTTLSGVTYHTEPLVQGIHNTLKIN